MLKIFHNKIQSLVIFTDNLDEIIEFFNNKFPVIISKKRESLNDSLIKEIYSKGISNETIIFISDNKKELLTFDSIYAMILVDEKISDLMVEILNYDQINNIKFWRFGPSAAVLNSYGESSLFFESIKKDLKGTSGSYRELIERYNSGTVIMLINNEINKLNEEKKLLDEALYSPRDIDKIISKIKMNGIKYINSSINKEGWNEYDVMIIDNYKQSDNHYNRILLVIDALNLGLVLKSGMFNRSIGKKIFKMAQEKIIGNSVFYLKLYSPLKKQILKKIFVGLEYFESGEKIVDINLYLNNRKVPWQILKEPSFRNKEGLVKKARKHLLNKMGKKASELKLLEKELLIKRKKTINF